MELAGLVWIAIYLCMRTSAEDFRWIKQGQGETNNNEWKRKLFSLTGGIFMPRGAMYVCTYLGRCYHVIAITELTLLLLHRIAYPYWMGQRA